MAEQSAERSSLERGLRVIRLLIELESDPAMQHRGLSVQQVSVELGVHKSTASRILATLAEEGFAVQPERSRRGYRLGPALRSRFGLTPPQQRFRDLASPFLRELVGLTGECAHGAVAADGAALVLDAFETAQSLRVVLEKGRLLPLHSTSVGKCLLAWGLAPLPADLPARTGRTITDPARLRAHLETVRELGSRSTSRRTTPAAAASPLRCSMAAAARRSAASASADRSNGCTRASSRSLPRR